MIGPRYFLGLGIYSLLMAVTLIGSAISLMIAGHHDNQFVTMAMPWCGLGTLSIWISNFVRFQSERLAKLEAELDERAKN